MNAHEGCTKPETCRQFSTTHPEPHLSYTQIKVCLFYFFSSSSLSPYTEQSAHGGVSVALCINLPLQRSIQPDKMTNDSYVNAKGNILLIAFKITIILGAPGTRGGLVGAESKAGPQSLGHINQ